jgi:hypothetical protein
MARYGWWLAGGAIALVVAFVGLIFMGSQTSTILNTVATSVGQPGRAAPAATSQPKAPAGDAAGTTADDAGGLASAAADSGLKIAYTGSLELVVDDLDAAVAKGRAAVLTDGGYVAGSDESRTGDRQTAIITYRIPAGRWEDSLASLRGIAREVVGEQTKAAEVGGQLVDLDARLRNLRASEQVLVGIAEKTTQVSDLLDVQKQVTNVRGEIEQLDGRRAALEDQVAYGTLVTTYGLKVQQVKEAKAAWDPATDVDAASTKLMHVGRRVVSAGIWFGILWLPILAVGAVVLVLGLWLGRRIMPRVRAAWPAA